MEKIKDFEDSDNKSQKVSHNKVVGDKIDESSQPYKRLQN